MDFSREEARNIGKTSADTIMKKVSCDCLGAAVELVSNLDLVLELAQYERHGVEPFWQRRKPSQSLPDYLERKEFYKKQTSVKFLEEVRGDFKKAVEHCDINPICQAPICRGERIEKLIDRAIEEYRRGNLDPFLVDVLNEAIRDGLMLLCKPEHK